MKSLAKKIANTTCLCLVAPLALLVVVFEPLDGRDKLFQFSSQFMSIFPGIPGDYLRRAFYRWVLKSPHPGPTVNFGSIFAQRDTTFGERVYIGAFCNIGCSHIGDDTLIGSGVMIASPKMHCVEDMGVPINQQGGTIEKISIGSGSWLGNGSIILANVGHGCVIGAGSVVTTACEPYGIYVGNPARLLRFRGRPAEAKPARFSPN